MERPLLGGVVVLDVRPRHLARSLVHPDDEAKEDRPAADVGAVTGTFLEKGPHSGLANGKANDHPAAGSGSLSGHHAIVFLDESKNEPGPRATPCGLLVTDAIVLADKYQMLGSILRESDIDGPGSIVRERILEGVSGVLSPNPRNF
jgi:hypothetical protein